MAYLSFSSPCDFSLFLLDFTFHGDLTWWHRHASWKREEEKRKKDGYDREVSLSCSGMLMGFSIWAFFCFWAFCKVWLDQNVCSLFFGTEIELTVDQKLIDSNLV